MSQAALNAKIMLGGMGAPGGGGGGMGMGRPRKGGGVGELLIANQPGVGEQLQGA